MLNVFRACSNSAGSNHGWLIDNSEHDRSVKKDATADKGGSLYIRSVYVRGYSYHDMGEAFLMWFQAVLVEPPCRSADDSPMKQPMNSCMKLDLRLYHIRR
jgi:formylmethanofuran dehydrogenase subunit A